MRSEQPTTGDQTERIRRWRVPLSHGALTLRQARAELADFGLRQSEVPLAVQLIENPKYDLPGFDLFHGATDLATHDQIHILLGRGLLPKDEAFVIGFTMGTTDRVGQTEEALYAFIAKNLYPDGYRLDDDDLRVYRDAVRLGYVSACKRLDRVDFEPLQDLSLTEVRATIGLEEDLLRAYYAIERRRFPLSPESQRLLD